MLTSVGGNLNLPVKLRRFAVSQVIVTKNVSQEESLVTVNHRCDRGVWGFCREILFYIVLLNLLYICSIVECFGFYLGNGKVDREDGYCLY